MCPAPGAQWRIVRVSGELRTLGENGDFQAELTILGASKGKEGHSAVEGQTTLDPGFVWQESVTALRASSIRSVFANPECSRCVRVPCLCVPDEADEAKFTELLTSLGTEERLPPSLNHSCLLVR